MTVDGIKLFAPGKNLRPALIFLAIFASFIVLEDKWILHYSGTAELSNSLKEDEVQMKRLHDRLSASKQKKENAARETWSPNPAPGEKLDPDKILQSAKSLMEEGSYEESLQRYLWYFEYSRTNAALKGVRISFALSDWIELGRRYPKARQALVDIRDADVGRFARGQGYSELFQEVKAINGYLDEDEKTVALFGDVLKKDKRLAKECYYFVEDLLIEQGAYELCMNFVGDPQKRFETLRQSFEMQQATQQRMAEMRKSMEKRAAEMKNPYPMPPFYAGSPDMTQMATNYFVKEISGLVKILVGVGRQSDAEKIRDEALTVVDDDRLKSAVEDATQKIQTRTGPTQARTPVQPDVAPSSSTIDPATGLRITNIPSRINPATGMPVVEQAPANNR